MGEEFYCVIKLVSGEEVFSLVAKDENDGDPVLVLQTPIVMKMVNSPSGFFIKIRPWVETVNDDFFIVKPDKIITMTEVKDENLINLYTSYLENNDDEEIVNDLNDYNPRKKGRSSGKVKPSEKMGYISSVKEARKKLEEIFKLEVEDSKES
jgi:hypothetical protein